MWKTVYEPRRKSLEPTDVELMSWSVSWCKSIPCMVALAANTTFLIVELLG